MNRIALIFALLIGFSTGCKKDSGKDDTQPATGYTVFKNQTGDADADGLQAQFTDNNQQISFYGKFDAEGNPTQISGATYKKINGDTVVHMITDPVSNKVQTMYFEVNGVKQPLVMKFAFFGNDTSFRLSIHHYDWTNKTSTMQYESMIYTIAGKTIIDPVYGNFKVSGMSWFQASLYMNIGLYILYMVLEKPDFSNQLAMYLPTLKYFNSIWTILMSALYQTHLSMKHFSTAQPAPSSAQYPKNTPAINPSVNPTANLSKSPCSNTTINFWAQMSEQGKITIVDVTGGQAPYSYSISGIGGFQSSPTLSGTYAKGKEYDLLVKDAKGCMSTLTMSW